MKKDKNVVYKMTVLGEDFYQSGDDAWTNERYHYLYGNTEKELNDRFKKEFKKSTNRGSFGLILGEKTFKVVSIDKVIPEEVLERVF